MKRCISGNAEEHTAVPEALLKTISRAVRTVQSSDAHHEQWMTLVAQTQAVKQSMYVGSTDKARQLCDRTGESHSDSRVQDTASIKPIVVHSNVLQLALYWQYLGP